MPGTRFLCWLQEEAMLIVRAGQGRAQHRTAQHRRALAEPLHSPGSFYSGQNEVHLGGSGDMRTRVWCELSCVRCVGVGVKSSSSKSLGASPMRETAGGCSISTALAVPACCAPWDLTRTCTSPVSANTVGLSRVCKEPFSASLVDLRGSQRLFLLCTALS